MKNTKENKEKFFVQYWGQKVGVIEEIRVSSQEIEPWFMIESTDHDYLELKHLKDITDEECKDYLDLINMSYSDFWTSKDFRDSMGLGFGELDTHVVNYLRSKGYLVPYMGLSCEDLVNYGWVKLK